MSELEALKAENKQLKKDLGVALNFITGWAKLLQESQNQLLASGYTMLDLLAKQGLSSETEKLP